jgi:hypothetical protein
LVHDGDVERLGRGVFLRSEYSATVDTDATYENGSRRLRRVGQRRPSIPWASLTQPYRTAVIVRNHRRVMSRSTGWVHLPTAEAAAVQ